MSLRDYVRKRDFSRTKEPRGKKPRRRCSALQFVIQKHAASRLHYDFRLEVDGALKSWAVPKGIPYHRGEKHLAVEVEDHPLEYGTFEGVIPKGQYGGGTVMLWDKGTYESLGGDPKRDLSKGKLNFLLHGTKLDGEWTLLRMKRGEGDEWLLLKSGNDARPVSKKKDDQSAVSQRSMARISKERDAEWRFGREETVSSPLAFVSPMKATLVAEPPQSGDWLYELKFDGYRALALKNGDDVQLLSRNEKDFSKRFPEIVKAIASLPISSAALDGEIVALDAEARPSFQLLQALEAGDKRPPLAFYLFDILHAESEELMEMPLIERRKRLEKVMRSVKDPLRFSAEIRGDPNVLLDQVRERGLEGIIGKERNSVYETGRRSRSWIKLKCVREQEVVIGGYTPPEGARQHFGALLVGYYRGRKLHFAGKIGTGFTGATLKLLYRKMCALTQAKCPFVNLPEKQQGRWQQNITPGELKLCHWVQPRLVCQARFSEWTRDGKLRHGVFLGLREDKSANEVVRERASKPKSP